MPHRSALARRTLFGAVIGLLSAVLSPFSLCAQTRVDFHLLPATSMGPLDPATSPDGMWIAVSMRGDIWKLPTEGGEAVALTRGPDDHFEPTWSPDGRYLAMTIERDGNLDIAWIPVSGLEVGQRAKRLTFDPEIDLEPSWSPDGESLVFASRRSGSLDVYRLSLERAPSGELRPADAPEALVAGPRHEFRPSISPDGQSLLYVGPMRGRLGSGVVWVRSLADLAAPPRLVIDEETSYRAAPRWSPDGSKILYSSDAAGSNDIAVIAAAGGQRVRLTEDPLDELAPAWSADGRSVGFVSNHAGPPRLYRLDAAGGARSAWRRVTIDSHRPLYETGRVRGRIVKGDVKGDVHAGETVPARLIVEASDGRAYAEEDAFLRRFLVNDTYYSHVGGSFELELPAGRARLLAMRGFEYLPARLEVDVEPGSPRTVTMVMDRLIDLPARGWYSGDTHTHDLHEGRWGLTQEEFFARSRADDLHVTNALIHMDGTKLMGRWSDLTGEPHLGSDDDYVLFYSQEFRGSFGHVALLGLERFLMPLIGGAAGSPYPDDVLKLDYLDGVREQGGIGGFVHPYNGPTDTPAQASSADIPVHVALGRGEFYDVISAASLEWPSVGMYYRLLNCGFRLAATGGTDNFSDAFRDPSPGTARTYALLAEGLSYTAWLEAVRAGRTFASSGPLLLLEVDGATPGATLSLAEGAPDTLPVRLEAASIVPLDSVEVTANGEVVASFEPSGSERAWTFTGEVPIPDGGWIAARAVGPPHPLIGDAFPFAHTSPVWVEREGAEPRSASDARFLVEVIDELWRRVERRDTWTSPERKREYREKVEEARGALLAIVAEIESASVR